jgi:endonuclease III
VSGRKTANVILNTAFGEPTIAVDTHIFRVANRTGYCAGKECAGGGIEVAESRYPKNSAWMLTTG